MTVKIFKNVVLVLAAVLVGACSGGSGTTVVGNSTITIGQLDDGVSRVSIPLAVFDTETAEASVTDLLMPQALATTSSVLTGASFDIRINGQTTNSGVDPAPLFQSASNAVVFDLESLQDGDLLAFLIFRSNGTLVTFSGTTSSSGDAEAEEISGSTSSGFDALAERDFTTAISEYCAVFDADTTDTEAAFGCFISRQLALPESSEADTILAAFSEDEIDVATDLFEDVFDTMGTPSTIAKSFSYSEFDHLPFNDIFTGGFGFVGSSARLLDALIETGTTEAELKEEILALRDDYEEFEDMLDVVVADGSFTFTLPGELFGKSTDIEITHNDVQLFTGYVKGVVVSLNILEAYDVGVVIEDIVASSGTDIDQEILTADLNGTGETVNGVTVDTTPFLTLDNESLVTGSRDLLLESLTYLSSSLTAIVSGQTSESVEELFGSNAANNNNIEDALALVDELMESLEDGTLVQLTAVERRTVSVNLDAFFDNPPSASDVTDSDPFVFENDEVQIVESYFNDLLDGIAEY